MVQKMRQLVRRDRKVFPLHIPTEQYETIGAAADISGETMASFIRVAAVRAAVRKLAREGKRAA